MVYIYIYKRTGKYERFAVTMNDKDRNTKRKYNINWYDEYTCNENKLKCEYAFVGHQNHIIVFELCSITIVLYVNMRGVYVL